MEKQLSITALTCSALLALTNPVNADEYKDLRKNRQTHNNYQQMIDNAYKVLAKEDNTQLDTAKIKCKAKLGLVSICTGSICCGLPFDYWCWRSFWVHDAEHDSCRFSANFPNRDGDSTCAATDLFIVRRVGMAWLFRTAFRAVGRG